MSSDNSIRETLYNKFRLGMTPTADDFEDLIDSGTDATALVVGTIANERLADTVETTAFKGNGTQITDLNASNVTAGTLNSLRLPRQIDLEQLEDPNPNNPTETLLSSNVLKASDASITKLSVGDTDCFGDKKILVKNLPNASTSSRGIVRMASQQDLLNEATDRTVSAKQLVQEIDGAKSYTDKEVALLNAGVKFKKGVVTVVEVQTDLQANASFPTVDDYQIQEGDRVLFVGQNNPVENRVWVASEGNSWALADDFNGDLTQELFVGLSVEVLKGNRLRHSIWSIIDVNESQDEEDSSADSNSDHREILWHKRNDINNYQAGDGIVINGLTISADFASSEEIEEGENAEKSVTPEALANSNLMHHLFEFRSKSDFENGNTTVPEGKILALYI